MRTKLLLSTAVLGVAGIIAASAQVFSVNVVGYINVDVPPGFSMIANQLDNGDNTVAALLPTVPDGTTIYKFIPATGSYDVSSFEFGEWSQAGMTLNPGEGAFILNPGEAFQALFVGEVKQGALSTDLVAGFQIVASQVPQSAELDTVLGFPVAEGDQVFQFNNATSDYTVGSYEFGEWSLVPVPRVGEAFFVNKVAAGTWTRDFTVQ